MKKNPLRFGCQYCITAQACGAHDITCDCKCHVQESQNQEDDLLGDYPY